MKKKQQRSPGIALRASSISAGMIVAVYVFMQVLAYFKDNAVLALRGAAALGPYVAGFISMYVLPPALVFGTVMYLYARPFDRALERLRSGESLQPREAEKLRIAMLGFSYLVLFLNIFGFAMGYAILVIVEDGLAGFASPSRLVILASNCAGASMFASAQSSLHNLLFAELRDRLGMTEIGRRRRALSSSARQVLYVAVVAVYGVTFLQFNAHTLHSFQNLVSSSLAGERAGGPSAESLFREGIPSVITGIEGRWGYSIDSVPLPWEGGPTMEEREYRVFLLTAFYLAVVCVLCQWARSLESRREISSLRSRILDVVEGEGDLTRRLSLRSTDDFGELTEAVNRLLERFRLMISRITQASRETRGVAAAIDSVMRESESVTLTAFESVSALSGSIDGQVRDALGMRDALASLRSASVAVAEAVEAQRKFTDDTASAMEEMSANIRSVEAMTRRAGEVTSRLSERGASGAESVSETASAIGAIESSSSSVLKVLGSLSKIAGETNLLAMNAAIEAAHAGASGAGFAVVADEVRSLANGSAKQTRNVKELVKEMGGRVQRGVESSASTGQAFAQLAAGIEEAASITAEIAQAMREQSEGTKMVEHSIVQVVDTSRSVKERMDEQGRETEALGKELSEALSRFSALAASAREKAESMKLLESAFLAVRREVDRNLAAADALEAELAAFRT